METRELPTWLIRAKPKLQRRLQRLSLKIQERQLAKRDLPLRLPRVKHQRRSQRRYWPPLLEPLLQQLLLKMHQQRKKKRRRRHLMGKRRQPQLSK